MKFSWCWTRRKIGGKARELLLLLQLLMDKKHMELCWSMMKWTMAVDNIFVLRGLLYHSWLVIATSPEDCEIAVRTAKSNKRSGRNQKSVETPQMHYSWFWNNPKDFLISVTFYFCLKRIFYFLFFGVQVWAAMSKHLPCCLVSWQYLWFVVLKCEHHFCTLTILFPSQRASQGFPAVPALS